ncbi:bifunctional AP-4-A phosphorylase/ADP sulfurylase [Actinomortierella ambigua]|uniref:Bifunctional AP-4-A phosphorylase/ADP sulfurylase n=1 Tax=Actinomortierella ambigua TaxID=1343610 RepID=A0A9P6PYG8_9FUNG|nr:bifunctional AP-4-A phosphorylase/ADP sulfurylase [Actinomortierella ambigua]
MVAFRDDFEALLAATYSSALDAKELIFTPSEIHHSIETEFDVEFDVTYAPALAKKPHGILEIVEEDQACTGTSRPSTPVVRNVQKSNPFLPHTPALFVTDAGENHKILLNKFCIVPEHFLIVTKEFRPQTQPLSPQDLLTAWRSLKALPAHPESIVFFNCGTKAGASQPHKHLQVIPLKNGQPTPITKLVRRTLKARRGPSTIHPGQLFSVAFDCIHHLILFPQLPSDASEEDEEEMLVKTYISLMDAMLESLREEYATQHHLSEEERLQSAGALSSLSYNWIMTREFMLIAPRRQEGYGPLNINSLGFAGMVLAKTADELKVVKRLGVVGTVSKTGFQIKNEEEARAAEAKKQEEQAYFDQRIRK